MAKCAALLIQYDFVSPNVNCRHKDSNGTYLQMEKNPVTPQPPVDDDGTPVDLKQYAFGYFDDGLIYKWPTGIAPRHIHFEV